MKTFRQLKEELPANFIKMPQVDSADRKQKYVTGANGKPQKISVPAHEINFNKKLSVESYNNSYALDQAKTDILHHVTNTIPTSGNITKLHDLVHKVSKLGGSADDEYDKIVNNSVAHQKYKDASSLD
jgi:hypothetical protein